ECKPVVADSIALDGASRGDVLRGAADLEQGSAHPLARAILAAARSEGIEPQPVQDYASVPGKGAYGRVRGGLGDARAGSLDYLAESGIVVPPDVVAPLLRAGKTIVGVAGGGR